LLANRVSVGLGPKSPRLFAVAAVVAEAVVVVAEAVVAEAVVAEAVAAEAAAVAVVAAVWRGSAVGLVAPQQLRLGQ